MKARNMFSSKNNAKTLSANSFRVWRFGESAICRSVKRAEEIVRMAKVIDQGAHAVDCRGERIA